MRLVTDTIEFGTRELPRWNTISISGYHIREAGSTAVQELAFTIADGMAYVEAALGARPADRRLRRRALVLLQQPQRLLRGDRQVPRRAADLVPAHDRALPRRERALDLDALPHPDRRGQPHRPAAAQQPDPGRDPGAGRASSAGRSRSIPTRTTRRGRCPSAEAALLALRQQQIIAEETGRGEHRRPARRELVRRGADERDRARPSGATSTRSTGAAGWSRRSPRAIRSARSPMPPTASSASSTPASAGSSGSTATPTRASRSRSRCSRSRGVAARPARPPGADPARARRRGGRGGPGRVARGGPPPGLVRRQPDAPFPALRERVRDARASSARSCARSSASTASRSRSEPARE